MASILNFPGNLFAESPAIPVPTSPSAEEATLNRPRRGPHLVNLVTHPDTCLNDGKEFRDFSEFNKTGAHLDLEFARRSNRSRLRRLFSPSSYHDTWPQSAA
jgi:hypothetical protein